MRRRKVQLHISRVLALVLAALLLLPVLPAAFAAEGSGVCGSGVEWTLSGGVLTISGSGAMKNYTEQNPAPWQSYKNSIRAVVVKSGVTAVGDYAFFEMDKLTSATMATSVKRVGSWAFYGCFKLGMVDMNGVEEIERSAFERCYALTGVRLPESLGTLSYRAFYGCSGLVSVTVPAGVAVMEPSVFAHCSSLQNATILAGITKLPDWTFYKCEKLTYVTMAPTIREVGYEAFYECVVEEPEYSHAGQNSHTVTTTQKAEEGTSVTTNSSYTENDNSTVTSQTTTTKTEEGKTVDVVIDAVLENSDGWKDVSDQVDDGLKSADTVTADVYLKGDATLPGDDLGQFTGKDVQLTIHTSQGAVWHINGQDINEKELSKQYDLSFTLRPLTDPTEAQTAAVGDCKAFTVEFDNNIDFKVEVELPLGSELSRSNAAFFDPGKDGYTRVQTVMIDKEGAAHFYLARVAAKTEYLIGINVPVQAVEGDTPTVESVSDAIIPSTMTNEYPNLTPIKDVDYIVTGVNSSLGINIRQLTWIIVAVMGVSVIVVGTVIFIMNKKKLKNGYVPVFDDEEE